jgi:predicted transcriptional regulator
MRPQCREKGWEDRRKNTESIKMTEKGKEFAPCYEQLQNTFYFLPVAGLGK